MEIDPKRTHIEIDGNVAASLINAIKNLIRKDLLKAISEEVEHILITKVPEDFNNAVKETRGVVSLQKVKYFDRIGINIEVPHAFKVTDSSMIFALNGTVFDNHGLMVIPRQESVQMDGAVARFDHQIKLFINTYFLNTFMQTFLATSNYQLDVLDKNMNDGAKKRLKEVIYRYFPGVWVFFLTEDFDVHFSL